MNETRCLQCETVTSRQESFFELSLDIEQNSSLNTCLRNFRCVLWQLCSWASAHESDEMVRAESSPEKTASQLQCLAGVLAACLLELMWVPSAKGTLGAEDT